MLLVLYKTTTPKMHHDKPGSNVTDVPALETGARYLQTSTKLMNANTHNRTLLEVHMLFFISHNLVTTLTVNFSVNKQSIKLGSIGSTGSTDK